MDLFLNELSQKVLNTGNGYIIRDGFVFCSITDPANVYDALVIRSPEYAECWTPRRGRSDRTVDEHIRLVQEHQLEKALIIGHDLNFLRVCPSLQYLEVIPDDGVREVDYTPLYSLPNLKWLNCRASVGEEERPCGTIDYTKIQGLREVFVNLAEPGHQNLVQLVDLEHLGAEYYRGKNRSLRDFMGSPNLIELGIGQCRVSSLDGIEIAKYLKRVSISYCRTLQDISALASVKDSLTALAIESCGKITDFSVLEQLVHLEFLQLEGSNTLPSLAFLKKMKHLKTFVSTMTVADGDITPCLSLPYALIKDKKHYNLKNRDLSKCLESSKW